MKDKKLNRSQLAKKLGVTKGYITQVLNGDFDHRISKLVDLSLAINKYMRYYNHERKQWTRNRMSPVEYRDYLFSQLDRRG